MRRRPDRVDAGGKPTCVSRGRPSASQAAFAAAWVEATGHLLSGRATLTRYEDGVAAANLLYTSPSMGSTAAERVFALSIAGAQKTLYITNAYFAPDGNFIELLTAAAGRGVDVRILTTGARTDVRVVRFAGRAWYEILLAAGVRIYEWQPSTLHAKTFVVDGVWVTIGSIHFDNRSLALNDKATLMILNQKLGQQMGAIFFENLRHAEEIALQICARAAVTGPVATHPALTVHFAYCLGLASNFALQPAEQK